MKKRILHLIYSLDIGGSEQLVVDIINNLPKDKYQPFVCTIVNKGIMAESLENKGYKVFNLGKKGMLDILAFLKLMYLLKRLKIDVLHTHRFTANFWGRLAGLLTGINIIVTTEHGLDKYKGKFRVVIDKFLANYSKKIIAVSHEIKDFIVKHHGIPENKIRVVNNGIDINRIIKLNSIEYVEKDTLYTILEQKKINIGIIGRLDRVKGHEYFLESARQVLREGYSVMFYIIGDGPLYDEIKEYIDKYDLKDNVILAGSRNDIPRILNYLDIVTITSVSEGLPITLLESMAAKKAIIATSVGEIPNILTNGFNGILIKPKNYNQISTAIINLCKNPKLITMYGQNAYKSVFEKYHIKKTIKMYDEIYFG